MSVGKNSFALLIEKSSRQTLAVAPKVAAIANLFDLKLLRKLSGLSKDINAQTLLHIHVNNKRPTLKLV